MARCQAGVRNLPANSDHRHQPELDLMAVRLPVDVDVIKSNRSRSIVLAEMQADAIVHDAAISLSIANRIRKPLRRRDHIVNQPNFAQVEITAQVKSEEFIPEFLGNEVQDPDLLGQLKMYRVIVSLLGGRPRLGENGPCIFAKLAQPYTSEAGNSAGSGRYGAKLVSLVVTHESQSGLLQSLQRFRWRKQPEDWGASTILFSCLL